VEHTDKRRLRELLLLALRITALVLLAIAFARPFFATGAAIGTTGVTIVALDTSYSLSAPGRFDRAKQLAKRPLPRRPSEIS
jgi:N-terminal double-transmembrane domain